MERGGDSACWLHLVCEGCGNIIEGGSGHRPGCELAPAVQEIDVLSLPRAEKHATVFRFLDRLKLGEALRIANDHDPVPLRLALEHRAPAAFAWEYIERGPDRWRVSVRKLRAADLSPSGIEFGPTILRDEELS